MDAGGGEWHAIVGPNGPREPILVKEAIEDGADPDALGRAQALARQQIAGMLVGHGQRVAVDAISRPKVALEVGGPQIIRLSRGRGHHAGMRVGAATAALLHQPAARQQVAGGADRRPLPLRRLPPQQIGRAHV